jgi:hypothetical protein
MSRLLHYIQEQLCYSYEIRLLNHVAVVLCKFIQKFKFLWVTNERLNQTHALSVSIIISLPKFNIFPKDTGTETATVLCTK